MTDTRCACGYARSLHEATGHCPLCACGKLPAEHAPVTTPPSPLRAFAFTGPATYPPSPLLAGWPEHEVVAYTHTAPHVDWTCPGKPRSEAGKLPTVRRGSFREPAPDPTYVVLWSLDGYDVLTPEREVEQAVVVEAVVPPLVPARLTISLDEIAPRARPLGMAAAELGWTVTPWYWQAGDGTETSALVMRRDELRAVAYWERAPEASWKTGGARAWRDGEWPRAVAVTALRKYVDELGAPA